MPAGERGDRVMRFVETSNRNTRKTSTKELGRSRAKKMKLNLIARDLVRANKQLREEIRLLQVILFRLSCDRERKI